VTPSSVTAATGAIATPAPSAKLTGAHGSRSLQRSGDVSHLAGRSASGTEKAQTGGSFPSAIVSALAALLLALAMVIIPKLRRRPQTAAAGSVALHGADSPVVAATPSARESAPGRPGVGGRKLPFRRMTAPMDPVIAPMAADAYTSMADENRGNPGGSADEGQGGEAPGGA
jgi:hypothetical protein